MAMLMTQLPSHSQTCYFPFMQITMELPDAVARQLGETPSAVSRHVLEDAAIESYRCGRLSQRQVGAMLGLDYWRTETFLREHEVPLNYSPAELVDDGAALEKILSVP
jgi:hypothetical protein